MQAGCLRAISETRSKQTRVICQRFIYQLELLCGLVRPRGDYAPIHNLSLSLSIVTNPQEIKLHEIYNTICYNLKF